MKIIYVDAILSPPSAQNLFNETKNGLGLTLERLSIHPQTGIPPSEAFKKLAGTDLAGLVLSGSEKSVTHSTTDLWVKDYLKGLENFLLAWKKLQSPYPVLGICFAHQALAHVLGAEVKSSGSLKVGPIKTKRLPSAQACRLPFIEAELSKWDEFIAYHEDYVVTHPQEMDALLSSDYCPYQSFLHKKLPLWTVQFHPEMNESILEDSSDLETWSRYSRADFKNQKGNDFLKIFAEWIMSSQNQKAIQ